MLVSLSSQTSVASPTVSSTSVAKAHSVDSAAPVAQPATCAAVPGVTTHISQQAYAAAAKELESPQQPPPVSDSIFNLPDGVTRQVMDLGRQVVTTLRPPLQATAQAALDVTYLTELFMGHATNNPRYFTKAEYVEQYDVGAVLGYIRDALGDPAESPDLSAPRAGGLDAIAQEAWNKIERWTDRLRGPKVEYVEHVAVGAAVGYLIARIVNARRG